jgi:hypothetical protein
VQSRLAWVHILHQLHRLQKSTCLALVFKTAFSNNLTVSTDSHSQSYRPAAESRPGALASWSVVLAFVLSYLTLIRLVLLLQLCSNKCGHVPQAAPADPDPHFDLRQATATEAAHAHGGVRSV